MLKFDSPSSYPKCRWVCFFIRFGEMLHFITCSAMDALQWMGAVRMRVQTADKNITIIHKYPQLLSSQDVNWWTGVVVIIVMFLSAVWTLFWRHPFTAEHPLLRHWCNAAFLQLWWRNKLLHLLDGLRLSTFSAYFHF